MECALPPCPRGWRGGLGTTELLRLPRPPFVTGRGHPPPLALSLLPTLPVRKISKPVVRREESAPTQKEKGAGQSVPRGGRAGPLSQRAGQSVRGGERPRRHSSRRRARGREALSGGRAVATRTGVAVVTRCGEEQTVSAICCNAAVQASAAEGRAVQSLRRGLAQLVCVTRCSSRHELGSPCTPLEGRASPPTR